MLDVAPPWTAPTPDRTDSHVAGPLDWTAAGLLLAAAVVGVVSLFPAYYKGQGSLDTYAEQIVPAATVIAGWLVAGVLVSSRRGPLVAAGAWGAVGIAVSEAGLRLADFGELSTGVSAGEGLWLFTAAWAAASVGAVMAVAAVRGAGSGGRPVRPGPASEMDRTVGVVATGIGVLAAVAFIPSWDRYLATSSVDPTFFLDVTLGDAFKNPGVTIAGNVVTAVSFALVPLVAMLWRPMRVGGALLAGTLVVLAGQVVSATAQVLEKPDPFQVFTATQYAELRPTVTLHLTGWFDAELAALLALLLVAASRLHHHQEATLGGGTGMVPYSWPPAPAGAFVGGAPAGALWGGAPAGGAPVGSAPRVGAGWGGAAPQGVGPGGVGPGGGAAPGGQWGGPGGGAPSGGAPSGGAPSGGAWGGGAWGGGADPARPSPPRPAPRLPPWPEPGDAPRTAASHAPAAPPPVAPEQAEMVDVPTADPARPAAEAARPADEAAGPGPAPVPPVAPPPSPVAQAAPSAPPESVTSPPEPPSWGDVPPPMWHDRDGDGDPA